MPQEEDNQLNEEGEGSEEVDEATESEEEEEESDSEFDDPEGYVDDIPDEELLADLLKDKPVVETGYDKIIVVDNAPKVGPERMEKLKGVLNKVFGRFGTIVYQHYPVDEKNIFKGYFFLEFQTPEGAANAVKTGNGYKLDKSHIFAVNYFSDFDKYKNLPEKWEPPQKTDFVEFGNLRSWLLDENCYDQSAVLFNEGLQVAVCQNTHQEIKIVTQRERWTETYLLWSPKGSYLATLHKPGVALWGGPKFERVGKFEHVNVQLIDFSPCERYLVTFSNTVDDPNDPQNIIIWDIRSGSRKRSFTRGKSEEWPILKWSHDGKYFGRMTENLLSIYETPSFGLLDKKSLLVKGIRDFSWSPCDYKLAYWVPELGQIPAKIIVVELPSRQELSTKSRHYVSEFKLQWHKQGDFLAVRVDHFLTKSRKQLCHSLEIFHLREPLIPVDTIEIKDPVVAFSLEPQGTKLAVIHGEPPIRIFTTFYQINKGRKPTVTKTLERTVTNNILWSPSGQFVVLANLKGSESGHLEFWDTHAMTMMNSAEHQQATDVEWDATGRYVVSSVSIWKQKMDTGFYMWSFQGRPLYRSPPVLDKFCQFIWRPRPPTLLTEEHFKLIKKDQKKYYHTFEQKDRSSKTKASKELIEKRQKLMSQYNDYRQKAEQEAKKRRGELLEEGVDVEGVGQTELDYEEEELYILVNESKETVATE